MEFRWLLWAGISFIVGGTISLSLNFAVGKPLSYIEDLTSFSVGWIIVGVIFVIFGYVKNRPS